MHLDLPTFSDTQDGQSVGDSSHLLPDSEQPGRARAAPASSPEADAVTRYVVRTSATYPPLISIDLHEDDLVTAGYVYSQGELGTSDPLAQAAVAVLREHGIAIQLDGQTRFNETIVGGIIGPVTDSSIDELMSATSILVDGRAQAGPAAHTVLVFETPAKELPLDRRVAAHLTLLRRLAERIAARHLESPCRPPCACCPVGTTPPARRLSGSSTATTWPRFSAATSDAVRHASGGLRPQPSVGGRTRDRPAR